MSDDPTQISILDARLAEIDHRLRSIQTGLVGGDPGGQGAQGAHGAPTAPTAQVSELPPRVVVPEPSAPAPARAPDPARGPPAPRGEPAELIVGLRELAGVHERLLEAIRELMVAYEQAVSRLPATDPAPAPVRQVSVSAGPFESTEALRSFEQALAAIPAVREVEVRGYTGGDRALVDVQLTTPTS